MPRLDDLEDLKQAEPFVRSALAFMLFLRFGAPGAVRQEVSFNFCYELADLFLASLKTDLEASQ